jgi:hypothetical protein
MDVDLALVSDVKNGIYTDTSFHFLEFDGDPQ